MKKVFLCAIAMAFLGTAAVNAENPPAKSETKTEKKACCDKKGDAKSEKCAKSDAKSCDKSKQCCSKDGKHADKKCDKKDGGKSCCKDKAKSEKK